MFSDPKKLGAVFALSIVTAYFGMRFGMLMDAYGNNAASGFVYAYEHFWKSLLHSPLSFAGGKSSLMIALVGFIVPWGIYSYAAMQAGNFDPGKERGDAKWASPSEIKSLSDESHFLNNRIISKHHYQVMNLRGTGKERSVLTERYSDRNSNLYVFGASGSRKTVGIAKPALLNCIDEPTAVKLLNEIGDKKGLARLGAKASSSPDPEVKGCDLVMFDSKGGTLDDCGGLLKKADFDIRCFNTVDCKKSMRCNPIAYIPVREVDGSDPFSMEFAVRVTVNGGESSTFFLNAESGSVMENVPGTAVVVKVEPISYETETVSIEETVSDNLSDEESAILADAGLADKRDRRPLRGESAEEARARQTYEDAIRGISYRKTEMRLDVNIECNSDLQHDIEVLVDMPLTFDFKEYYSAFELTEIEAPWTERRMEGIEGVSRWQMKAELGGEGPFALTENLLTIIGGPIPGRVPDGVELVSIVNCLVKNLSSHQKSNSKDPFWEKTEILFFMAGIAYQIERWEDSKWWNLGEVIELLSMGDVSMDKSQESDLDKIMRQWEEGYAEVEEESSSNPFGRERTSTVLKVPTELGPHDPSTSLALHCYKSFKQAAPETIQSILISCSSDLVKLFPQEVKDLLSEDELELDAFGDPARKQALFLIFDDQDDTFDFLFAMIAFLTVKYACQNAYRKYGGSLPRQLCLVLDEFANIGRLPNFDRTISVVRSRNISVTICVQSKAQAVKNYSEEEASIIQDNCSTLVYLSGRSEKTAKELSAMIGDETIHEKTRSETRGSNRSRSESRQSLSRPLITAAQLIGLPSDECVILASGLRNPIRDKKYPLAEHPLYPFIDPGSSSEIHRRRAGDTKGPRAHCYFDTKFDFVAYRDEVREERLRERKGKGVRTVKAT